MRRSWFVLVAGLLVAGCNGNGADGNNDNGGDANTITVNPGDSIQAAVDQAQPGQTVLIQPGTYRPSGAAEALVVIRASKSGITIRGGGATAADVVVDGNDQVLHVFFFDEGIGRSTVIENLTVTGGRAYPEELFPAGFTSVLRPELNQDGDFYHDGAGLMLFMCAPTVRNCRIEGNEASRCGGGISVFNPGDAAFPNPGPLITGNQITGNLLDDGFGGTGGGIDVYFNARATIANNLFVGNRGWGSGVAVLDGGVADLDCNTLVGNTRSAFAITATATATLSNCIITGTVDGLPVDSSGALTMSNCCFWDNAEGYVPPAGQGHLVDDPLFVAGAGGAYYLSETAAGQGATSPCVDAGSTTSAACGVASRTTRTDGVADAGTVDMGYHYPT